MKTKDYTPIPTKFEWNEQRAQMLLDAITARRLKDMELADRKACLAHVAELHEVLALINAMDERCPF